MKAKMREGGRREDKIMMLNHVQGGLGRLEVFEIQLKARFHNLIFL